MDRILQRRESLRQNLRAGNLDALLVSSPTNVAYLTGFTGDSSVLLVGARNGTSSSPMAVSPRSSIRNARGSRPTSGPARKTMNQAIAQAGRFLGVRRLGFESACPERGRFRDDSVRPCPG